MPAREARVISGFKEIQDFVQTHGRQPQHGNDRDIFEQLYATRLDRLRALPEYHDMLAAFDSQGLLAGVANRPAIDAEVDLEGLADALAEMRPADDITVLRNVRTSAEKRTAEEIGTREPCVDFEQFQTLFDQVRREIKEGVRESLIVHALDEIKLEEIQQGQFFIVGGQLAYIAAVGEKLRTQYERSDSRLRVIFDNGTESDVLQRSFQRSLYRDQSARMVTNLSVGPLFSGALSENDRESGTIYVVRSKSELPLVAAHRDVLHKIGVTGQSKVEARFANAKNDPTFLLADVERVATYNLFNIDRVKLENIIHRVFEAARLDITITDRFGKPVVPREWFLAPLFIIDQVVERIMDGSIVRYTYDPKTVELVEADGATKQTKSRRKKG
ncbi:GIY-YIG nuclease family protein [Gemmatimonas sp.]|uniref:GIY-YIG nuclease family protein n=1 Tax=Gemmatimonas sp. TaxID=1962908 RepID=UPI003DA3218A